jgi:hypothetical protein
MPLLFQLCQAAQVTVAPPTTTQVSSTLTLQRVIATSLPAYSLESQAGNPRSNRWSEWIGIGGSITAITGGVNITAGVANGGDAAAVQMWAKAKWSPAGGTKVKFRATRRDTAVGSGVEPAMLGYWATQGDATANHPADPNAWTTATAATRWEFNCNGLRVSYGPRGGTGTNNDQVRTREQTADGTLGTQILGTGLPNMQPGNFSFAKDVAYDCEVTIANGVFTFKQTKVSDGTVKTISDPNAAYTAPTQGWIGIRAMETCSFDIINYTVEEVTVDTDPFNELPAATRIVAIGDRTDFDAYFGAAGNPKAGDRLVLSNGVYLGGDITITLPRTGTNAPTAAKPFVICCDGSANIGKVIIRFMIHYDGHYPVFWGCKFEANALVRCGRVDFIGSDFPVVQRCEFTDWFHDVTRPTTQGHAIDFHPTGSKDTPADYGGTSALIQRCFLHDPKPYQPAEIVAGGLSDRHFIRITASTFAKLHKNGVIDQCYFGSTIGRPIPGAYDSGQADLLEVGGNGPSYGPNDYIEWTIQNTLFDGTGEGGPPVGYTMTLNGNCDTKAAGVVDNKIGGVHYDNCTFRNFRKRNTTNNGDLDFRFGHHCTARRCYFKNGAVLSMFGYQHRAISNFFDNASDSYLSVPDGEQVYTDYGSGHQASTESQLQDNQGKCLLGDHTDTDANSYVFPALNAKFWGSHNGNIIAGGAREA